MFPIAWAVVEGENRSSWTWFIEILRESLEMADGNGWSVISDQQKGLVEALCDLLPFAEHRKCARHVSANWKIKHKSSAGRKAFWDAVYSSNVADYNVHLAELKALQDSGDDPDCYNDFLKYDPKTFSRAYVSRVPKCDSIESNICETFNGCIVKYRGLRIINMLEGIRTYVMTRVVAKSKVLRSSDCRLLCPRIAEKLERGKVMARNCFVRQTLQLVCECEIGGKGYVVDLDKNTCTCGYWELSGIPCVHAIASASYLRKDIYYWTDKAYTTCHAREAYGFGGIPALPGQQAWEQADGLEIRPPMTRLMPGRPKKNRRKEMQELEVRPAKNGAGTVIRRKGIVMHCRNCNSRGHNARRCPNKEVEQGDEPPPRRSRRNQAPRAEEEEAPRRGQCSKCRTVGHNARTCPMLKGLQVRLVYYSF
ncbi:hypothetical protein LINPERHAP2_LOCUS20779 [Linum perenne]